MRNAIPLLILLLSNAFGQAVFAQSLPQDTLEQRLSAVPYGAEDDAFIADALRLAKELNHAGRSKEAIAWGKRALDATEQLHGTQNAGYAQALSDLAGSYSHAGSYEEALRLGNAALTLREETCGKNSLEYAQSLNNTARYHAYLGHYIEAIRLGRKAMELREQLSGTDDADYAQSASNLAGYYSPIGNYDEALRLGTLALSIREKVTGTESLDYAQSLNNLAKYHYFKGQYDEAIRMESQALALREKLLGKHHPDYATALSNMADYHMMIGDYEKALEYGSEALTIRRETLGTDHPEYAESTSNMASYHHARGHHAEAVAYGRETLLLRRRLLGEQHLSYAHSVCKMAVYFSAANEPDSASFYALEATTLYSKSILNTFADLTSSERELFWLRVKPWFTRTLPQLVWQNPTDGMVSSAYNATLLAKGLLLNSELEMANLLMESGDTLLIDAYHQLQSNQALLTHQYSLPKSKRTINTDSLQKVITRQERKLVKQSKTYGNYTKPLRIDWERIHRQLHREDVAVEFLYFPDSKGDAQYAAIVLTKEMHKPAYIPLMSGAQLSSVRSKDIYTTNKVSQMVWQPLAPYLEHAHNVYFSPAGELYNIGIESLPHWGEDQGLLMDHWLFYRLSSTREIALAREHTKVSYSDMAIYGGVNYDSDLDDDDSTSDDPQSTKKLKGGAKYLPGTRKEVEDINHMVSDNELATNLHMKGDASEKSFKHLSGHAPTIIHIATHGFYWTDSEVRDGGMDDRLMFLSTYGNMDDADKALTRSGLLLAGANHTLTGVNNVQATEDGVLTAKEISMLDLRGVDLLVLSACQTGLGKITGDGVFGLQRGFKKAGANAILMSLWKVDDHATRLLMNSFYKYLMDGMDKHEALRRAQTDLRTMEVETERRTSSRRAIGTRGRRNRTTVMKRPYTDPYYWAAFILLDGME